VKSQGARKKNDRERDATARTVLRYQDCLLEHLGQEKQELESTLQS
jgi:hypothetical protein